MEIEALKELLERIGIKRVVQRNQNLQGLCPFHNERNPSWGISVNEPHLFGCFGCGRRGSLTTLLLEVGGYTKAQANRVVRENADYKTLPQLRFNVKQQIEFDETELYPYTFSKRAAHYCRHRGLDPVRLRNMGCVDDTTNNRLVFPWRLNGRVLGATGRALEESDGPKMLPYGGMKKGKLLFLPSGRIFSREPLILVEGEIDALKVLCSGFRNVAALGFGSFTKDQSKLVSESGVRELMLFFDDDETGARLCEEVNARMRHVCHVHRVNYASFRDDYEGKLDPGAMVRDDIREVLTKRIIKNAWSLDF